MKKSTVPLFLVSLGMASSLSGAILAQYNLDGSSASSDTDPTSTAGNFGIANGGGTINGGTPTGISGSTNSAYFRNDNLTSMATTAVSVGDYFTFTFTPNPGSTYSLTTLTLQFGGSNFTNSTSPTDDFTASAFLRTNAEASAYTTNVGSEMTRLVTGGNNANQFSPFSIDLSGANFQNITDAVTFRIYTYSSSSSGNTFNRMDDVVLNGTVVPEPSTSLLALAACGLVTLRRKR